MHDLSTVIERLGAHAALITPRILTQVCRDPNSAACGSFDRDWWHYRIRDFSSVILQQGAYAIWLASRLDAFTDCRDDIARLAAAGCRFWNARAIRRGAFEEYYPWERGYAPLAFSTLAIMKLAAAGVISAGEVQAGAKIAARQLMRYFESEAANQQVAGLAALAWIGKVFPHLAEPDVFAVLAQKTMALQTAEGWFMEYGGPDLAYLSIALDCLWDLHDATGEACYVKAAEQALAYMAPYVLLFGASIGMHNARNTDYILPYGLSRFAVHGTGRSAQLAATVLVCLYESLPAPEHFAHAIDDRYHSHYSGHSIIRAYLCLSGKYSSADDRGIPQADAARQTAMQKAEASIPFDKPDSPVEFLLPECGHYLKRGLANDMSILLSLRKGGILTAVHGRQRVSDYGWHVSVGNRQFVNHWWSDQWTWTRDGNRFCIRGRLVPHHEILSTPLKHLVLRTLSFLLGDMIIPVLKRLLIFKHQRSPYAFERVVTIAPRRIIVCDRIDNLPAAAVVLSAPRASKRHVSSADSYHREDLRLAEGVACRRTRNVVQGVFTAETAYDFT
ncbi:MAG: hypothetical protein NT011_09435 [Kiritimatiellaeota bacterium]|nr:hypothetical protein [Kiritimatiellota bacterium]